MTKCAAILAPHPDDECLMGLLPLRLKEECGFRIHVIPATLGSRTDRRAARLRELQESCRRLGFRLEGGAAARSGIRPADLANRLVRMKPAVIFMPHAGDGHPTHQTVHRLGVAAMDAVPGGGWNVVETEYWHPLRQPNLMVVAGADQVATLVEALNCHRGEMARNDYAARLPAWMIDNVRRGTERIVGMGAAAGAWTYAVLYRARRRMNSRWEMSVRGPRVVESSGDLGAWVQALPEAAGAAPSRPARKATAAPMKSRKSG